MIGQENPGANGTGRGGATGSLHTKNSKQSQQDADVI